MPIFRIAKVMLIPSEIGSPWSNAARLEWKPGQPKPKSKLELTTEFGVRLPLRLGDYDTFVMKADKEDWALSLLTQRAFSEIQLADSFKRKALEVLRGADKREIAEIIERLYPISIPYLVLGRHGNPVHHTLKVVEIMSEIAIGEKLSNDEVKTVCTAALLHDAGFARTEAGKIRKADIDAVADPVEKEGKRTEAIQSRKAHMLMGASLAWEILTEFNQRYAGEGYNFSPLEIRRIQEIICRHDDPTIEELTGTNSGEWLFLPEEKLLRMHREADRLWMLTPEGLKVDLDRDAEKGKANSQKRLQGNIDRHREEGILYTQAFADEAKMFELKGGTFYSSPTAFVLYHQFIEDSANVYSIDLGSIKK